MNWMHHTMNPTKWESEIEGKMDALSGVEGKEDRVKGESIQDTLHTALKLSE